MTERERGSKTSGTSPGAPGFSARTASSARSVAAGGTQRAEKTDRAENAAGGGQPADGGQAADGGMAAGGGDRLGDASRPAGGFSAWLDEIEAALRGERDADVPCDGCIACCSSSQFVHIAPDEADALAHIPRQLLFPAPRLPRGHVLMGYDERGRCPMLRDGGCSIYEHRPRTCRTYDCRVFSAAGIEPDDDKPLVAARVREWRFEHPTELDEVEHAAVQAAAAFVAAREAELPEGSVPPGATQRAVQAVELHGLFVRRAAGGEAALQEPTIEAVRVELDRRRRA